MIPPPNILLVAPYDRYASIDRFADCLEQQLSTRLPIRALRPRKVLGRFARGALAKWCGYVDKFIVFPGVLKRESAGDALVHLVDQSLAVFTKHLQGKPHLLGCNDLIAVRAALGEFPGQRVAWTGQWLQRAILRGIKSAERVVCISEATRLDALRLTGRADSSVSHIPMGLHFPFRRMELAESQTVVRGRLPGAPYLLHVGGNQWYKNRESVLAIFEQLISGPDPKLNLVLVGEQLTSSMRRFVQEHRMERRVFVLDTISDEELCALYSQAEALIFPSLAEGFGWPIIEAQACGCPVITTNARPMTEVGGSAATYIDPSDLSGSAGAIRRLMGESVETKSALREAGYHNVTRFSTEGMINAYVELYSSIAMVRERARIIGPAFA